MTDEEGVPNPFDLRQGNTLPRGNKLQRLERERDGQTEINFPAFFPVVHHDIANEIRPKHKMLVRLMYYTGGSIGLALMFCVLVSLMSSDMETCLSLSSFSAIKETFMSIFYAVLYPSLIFYVQYWPFYRACRDDVKYKAAKGVQVFIIIMMLVMVIGVPGTGMVGFAYLTSAIKTGTKTNITMSAIASIWNLLNLVLESMALVMLCEL